MTVDDPAEQEEFRQTIQKNNVLLLQLFSDIIDLSKIDAGSFEYMPKPVYLYQFCAMMLQKMKDRVPEGVELRIDEDSPLDAWFNADSGYLNQVITNFVSNAIKFTHRGTITIGYQIDAARQLEMASAFLCARALSKRWADVSASLPNLGRAHASGLRFQFLLVYPHAKSEINNDLYP